MAAEAAAGAPPRARPQWVETLLGQTLALLAAFLFAGVVGSVIIVSFAENPLEVYATIWDFSTTSAANFARVLADATPLIYSGLAVAVAFKAGLFNIGVEGQYIVGMMTAATAAVTLDFLPGILHLTAVVIAAVMGSMAWAFVPAILKVKTGAHEVVTTIMMNGIAVALVGWALTGPLKTAEKGLIDLRTERFAESARIPTIPDSLGLQDVPPSVYLTWLFPLALLACIGMWFLMYRMRLGYEVRAVGTSAGSAEAGGISIGATQVKIFLISGFLAGFVGLNHLLAERGYLGGIYETGLGFAGIAVAFLGRNSPIGIPLAAILLGMLSRGEDGIAVTTTLPREILIILEGLLILSVVIAYGVANRMLARRRQRVERAEEAAAGVRT
jgi:simple sugar transport system permease protein